MSGRKQDNQNPATDGPALSRLLHDLNQPLSAINNYAQAAIQLIDNRLADEARLKELFTKIAAQSTRATALSQEMSKTLAHEEPRR
jgi:C4-dicarboxylate-specific signal transduction histidine kinase